MELSSKDLWGIVQPRLREHMSRTWEVDTVARVTGSTPATVAAWLFDQAPPGGRIIKLWHLLAALGYPSPELDELPEFNRLFGQIYTFADVVLDDLKVMTNLAADQDVLRVIRGATPSNPAMTASDLLELHGAELDAAITDLTKVMPATPQAFKVAQPADDQQVLSLPGVGDQVLATAMVLNMALPLVRHMDDEASPEMRSHLRTLMGEEVMFHLTNHIAHLCGERARANRK